MRLCGSAYLLLNQRHTMKSQVRFSRTRGFAALALLQGLCLGNFALAQGSLSSGDVPNPLGRAEFLRAAAQTLNAPEAAIQLERIEGPVQLPLTGRTLWVASALEGERKVTVALDADGNSVDLVAAQDAERVRNAQQRGKFAPALFERLQAAPEEPTLAALWLDVEGVEDARLEMALAIELLDAAGQADAAAIDAQLERLAQNVAAIIGPRTRGMADELARAGIEVLLADTQAPLVFVRTTPSRLALLAQDARILELDSAAGEYGPRLSNAFKEVRADKLYSTFFGANADTARVAIVEGGRPCDTAILDIVESRTSGSTSAHTTGVAGCVGSFHGTHKGIAQGVKLYGANGANMTPGSTYTSGFAGSVDAINWAISKGCQVMNLSYGAGSPTATVTGFDKYLDYVARYNARSLAIACGNSGAYAGDPGAGYNQLAVGSFDDQNDYDWNFEPMSGFSSWQNPSTGVETPQLAAPGSGLNMPDCSGGTSYFASGTSFSAPIVAGIAALLVDRQPALGGWPEPVRAILMASAWNNIEGSASLSAQDGAGGVDAIAAYRVANRGPSWGYQYGSLTSTSFDASSLYTAQTVYISAGVSVRACLSFDSQVKKNEISWIGLTWFDSTLASDLDFRAYGPTGALVASSSSSLQPFEMLSFTAPTSGYYTFKIRKWSFGTGSEYFGTAVSLGYEKGE
jgi:Subtilase family